ncbi:MAG: hypothetical protein IPM34_03680 [Saprospiraceae bacterium]|nr:hypothetical protein [Saprospiraceae bacterium]
MKNPFILKLVLIVAFNHQTIIAQVEESKQSMSLGVQNGLTVQIPEAREDFIEDVLKKYLKNAGKLKKNKKAGEHFIMAANLTTLNNGSPLDLYVQIGDYRATMFFDLKTAFLNSKEHPDLYSKAKEFVQEFSFETQRAWTREQLEKEEDALKKLNKKLKDLVSDNASYHKDIEEAKAKIKKREEQISQNNKDQEGTKVQIETQTKTLESVQKKLEGIGKRP